MSIQGIRTNPDKVRDIRKRPEPKIITEDQSFHAFASYTRFIRRFNSIVTPIIDCLKNGPFQWTSTTSYVVREIKETMLYALVLRHPNLGTTLEEC